MNEITKPPQWLELPDHNPIDTPAIDQEEFPEKAEYWSCTGKVIDRDKPASKDNDIWITLYYTQEEAEASVTETDDNIWIWDKKRASTVSISDALYEARCYQADGVRIMVYRNNKWIVAKTYLSNVPLKPNE